jgi:hypothetical protein
MSEAQIHTGGCHCGAVRFRATADISTVLECNCSHCSAKGLLLAFTPVEAFVLEQGEDTLTEYRFNTHNIAHQFCRVCGVQPFARAVSPKGEPTVALNVRSLDGMDETRLNRQPFDGLSR